MAWRIQAARDGARDGTALLQYHRIHDDCAVNRQAAGAIRFVCMCSNLGAARLFRRPGLDRFGCLPTMDV